MLTNRCALTTIFEVGQTWTARRPGAAKIDITAVDPQGNPYIRDRSNGQTELISAHYLKICYFHHSEDTKTKDTKTMDTKAIFPDDPNTAPMLAEVAAYQSRPLLAPLPDVYAVVLAFAYDQENDLTNTELVHQWAANFPQYADELLAVAFARTAMGWRIDDPLEEGAEDLEMTEIGRQALAELLPESSKPDSGKVVGTNLGMAIYSDCPQCNGSGVGYDGWFCSTCQAIHYANLPKDEE